MNSGGEDFCFFGAPILLLFILCLPMVLLSTLHSLHSLNLFVLEETAFFGYIYIGITIGTMRKAGNYVSLLFLSIMRESVGGFYLGVCVFMVGLVFTFEDLSCVYITVGGYIKRHSLECCFFVCHAIERLTFIATIYHNRPFLRI